MLSPQVRGIRTRIRERVEGKSLVSVVGVGGAQKKAMTAPFFSSCRGPTAAQCAHRVSAFGFVSGRRTEVGLRDEKQAVRVECWLLGLGAAAHTPDGALEKETRRREGAWKGRKAPEVPDSPST